MDEESPPTYSQPPWKWEHIAPAEKVLSLALATAFDAEDRLCRLLNRITQSPHKRKVQPKPDTARDYLCALVKATSRLNHLADSALAAIQDQEEEDEP